MKPIIICIVLLAFVHSTHAADSTFTGTPEFATRKVISTALVGGLLVGSLVDSYFAWWKDASNPFTFHAEGWFNNPQLGIDKAGHLFTSYFYFHTFRNLMLWGGYDRSTALWWAAGASTFFAVSVEIGDGVSEYAFDYQDLVLNLAGIGYGMLQTDYPLLQNFNLKWSYVPRDGYRFPPRFTERYDAHTYWLTVNVHNLLPTPIRDYWPAFIQLAAGYGVDDRVSKRELVVGLDLNLEAFSVQNQELALLQKTLNMFHYPAPAVKFTQQKIPRYYFFQRD